MHFYINSLPLLSKNTFRFKPYNISSKGNLYFSWFCASDGDVHFAGNSVRSLGPHPSILTGLALKIIMGPMLFFRWNPRKESFRKLWGPRKRRMARLKPGKRGMAVKLFVFLFKTYQISLSSIFDSRPALPPMAPA